jgi:hypothetical protein
MIVEVMNKNLFRTVMLALSLIFAALVGILSILEAGSITTVAAVGGVLLGLGWALYGVVGPGKKAD